MLVTNLLAAGAWGAIALAAAPPAQRRASGTCSESPRRRSSSRSRAGAILLLLGHEAADGLHYVYGVLPLLVTLLAEAARAGAAERELAGIDFESLPTERQRLVALAIVRRETGIMADLGAGRPRPRPARGRDERGTLVAG